MVRWILESKKKKIKIMSILKLQCVISGIVWYKQHFCHDRLPRAAGFTQQTAQAHSTGYIAYILLLSIP